MAGLRKYILPTLFFVSVMGIYQNETYMQSNNNISMASFEEIETKKEEETLDSNLITKAMYINTWIFNDQGKLELKEDGSYIYYKNYPIEENTIDKGNWSVSIVYDIEDKLDRPMLSLERTYKENVDGTFEEGENAKLKTDYFVMNYNINNGEPIIDLKDRIQNVKKIVYTETYKNQSVSRAMPISLEPIIESSYEIINDNIEKALIIYNNFNLDEDTQYKVFNSENVEVFQGETFPKELDNKKFIYVVIPDEIPNNNDYRIEFNLNNDIRVLNFKY